MVPRMTIAKAKHKKQNTVHSRPLEHMEVLEVATHRRPELHEVEVAHNPLKAAGRWPRVI